MCYVRDTRLNQLVKYVLYLTTLTRAFTDPLDDESVNSLKSMDGEVAGKYSSMFAINVFEVYL